MKAIFLIHLFVLIVWSISPDVAYASAGVPTGEILKLGGSARSASLGEAAAADSLDATILFYNPAGLAYQKQGTARLTHGLLPESITYDVAGVAYPFTGLGTLAVGFQNLSYGSFNSLDNTGVNDGTVSPRDTAATMAWGGTMGSGVAVGLGVKYISLKITRSVSAMAFDFGMQKKVGRLALGLSVNNLGSDVKYNSVSEKLPATARVGAAYQFEQISLLADFIRPFDDPSWLAVGIEYMPVHSTSTGIAIRVGYNTIASKTEELNGFTAGFGVNLSRWNLDYAFIPLGVLGNTHWFAIGLKWE